MSSEPTGTSPGTRVRAIRICSRPGRASLAGVAVSVAISPCVQLVSLLLGVVPLRPVRPAVEVAALRFTDVDLSAGEDVVVTRRHATTNAAGERPDVRRLVGGCAAAIRRLHAATTPEPADPVIGLSGDQINKRFAAACSAAGLEGRRTSHGGRVGLAVELTARGASTHAIQLAGGWKTPSMVVRYAATVATRDGGVSRYLR